MLQWLCCCPSRRRPPDLSETDDPSARPGPDEHTPLFSGRRSDRTESTNWSPRPSPSSSTKDLSTSLSSASSEDMVVTPSKNGGPSLVQRSVPPFTAISPKLARVPFPRRRRQDEAPSPRQTTCTARLASLFNAQTRHLGLPVLLFLNLEWRERQRIAKTCKLYYKLWYLYDFTPRIMHDGAFGAQVSITPGGMAYRCVVDMYGQSMPHGFEAVTSLSGPALVSCNMEIYPGHTIRRFLSGVMTPFARQGLKARQELKLRVNASDKGPSTFTPSGCILVRAHWIPARHPPEQDGIIETWSVGPNGGNLTIRDLVQIATLQNPKGVGGMHPVEGFTPLQDRQNMWTGLDQRPPLPDLPPGCSRMICKTEQVSFAHSTMCMLKYAAQHIVSAAKAGDTRCACCVPTSLNPKTCS